MHELTSDEPTQPVRSGGAQPLHAEDELPHLAEGHWRSLEERELVALECGRAHVLVRVGVARARSLAASEDGVDGDDL